MCSELNVWDEVLEVNRLAKCISLEGHWEAMLGLLEAVRATVRMAFPEISFVTAVHQAGNGRMSSGTLRRQNAWGLLSRGSVDKKEERRKKMRCISCWGGQECDPRKSVESWERWLWWSCASVFLCVHAVREDED